MKQTARRTPKRQFVTIRLADGDVPTLRVVRRSSELWLAVYDDDSEATPLVVAILSPAERRALVRALRG